MTYQAREALLRELSNHPDTEAPLMFGPGLDTEGLCLLLFAAVLCEVEPTQLSVSDLMRYLARPSRR